MKKRGVLLRLYTIFSKIQRGNYPSLKRLIREISEELGEEVSERTIKRDIKTLRDGYKLPLEYDRRKGEYYFSEKCSFPFPPLTSGEVMALMISANLFHQFKNTPLEEDFENLGKKLEELFTDKISLDSKTLDMALSVSLFPIKMKVNIKDTFDKIFKAIREKKRVLIEYYTITSGKRKTRKVDPYHIYNYEGVWYFCGYCHLRKEVRDFALDRIENIKILDESFDIPKDFNIREYLNSAFRMYKGEPVKVKIRFDDYQARWIKERIWHETQKIQELDNGEIILEITANSEEIKRWIMSYGSHAEVLEPEFLREEIRKEIEKLKEIYGIGIL
ncbi:MAG: WYL domain-containing protein [Dictyoglomus turgidum]|nr:MAG: WYL domain-containing protein [Dictyoglomus turgidum]